MTEFIFTLLIDIINFFKLNLFQKMKSIINVNLYAKLDNSHNSFYYVIVTLQFGELVLVILNG